MFRKIVFTLLIVIFSLPLMGSEISQMTKLKFVRKVAEIDSTTCTSYTETLFYFDKDMPLFKLPDSDSTQYLHYSSSGTYGLHVRLDTVAVLASATFPNSDSLFIYVKPISPSGGVVHNDSTFITPTATTTGFDWYAEIDYYWDFYLGPCIGVAVYTRINCDTGAARVEQWITQ